MLFQLFGAKWSQRQSDQLSSQSLERVNIGGCDGHVVGAALWFQEL